jgi:hypothetical protein
MKLKLVGCLALLAMLFLPAALRADVNDNANIFSKQAVDDANRDMRKMKQTHNKEFVVETFAAIPDDQKDAYAQNKQTFFRTWMASRAKQLKVNGVYVLICMDPKKLEAGVERTTREHGDFTQTDLDRLTTEMRDSLRSNEPDKALSDAVDLVERAYTANISEANGRSSYTPRSGEYMPGQYRPGTYSSHSTSSPAGKFGTIICTIVGVVIIFSLIRAILRGSGGGGGYPTGNYGGTYGSGYGGGGPGYGAGGFGGGGGGGFGRGLLGGLLGGALGSYVENRWENNSGNNTGNQQGGFSSGGDFGGGGGSSFDSGPSDPGQGFGDMSSGGDFGSSDGGGGDSGGGSSGGDF